MVRGGGHAAGSQAPTRHRARGTAIDARVRNCESRVHVGTTGGTPRAVIERLHAELSRALALPDVRARLTGLGGEPGALSVPQFSEMNRADYERSGRLIREAGIKID